MKKIGIIAIISVLMFVLVTPGAVFAHTEGDPFVTDLIAGQHYDVGQVNVWNDADDLHVEYIVDEGDWQLNLTHLAVAKKLKDIPQKKGNPPPGKFAYSGGADYVIPLEDLDAEVGDMLYIAAHAEVGMMPIGPTEDNLPDQASITLVYAQCGDPAYFPHIYVTDGSIAGDYLGYCVDTDESIHQNEPYDVNVYSSYEELPEGLIEYPENLDLVNYIINNFAVGMPSSGCEGAYTYGDIQRAIWTLLDDEIALNNLCEWTQCRVDEILAAANANGEGFVPGCGDSLVIILAPVGKYQIVMIWLDVPCGGDETAWADGEDFPGKNWAMYFTYEVQ